MTRTEDAHSRTARSARLLTLSCYIAFVSVDDTGLEVGCWIFRLRAAARSLDQFWVAVDHGRCEIGSRIEQSGIAVDHGRCEISSRIEWIACREYERCGGKSTPKSDRYQYGFQWMHGFAPDLSRGLSTTGPPQEELPCSSLRTRADGVHFLMSALDPFAHGPSIVEAGHLPGPDSSRVEMNEIGSAVVTDATATEGEGDLADGAGAYVAHAQVDGFTFHVQTVFGHAVTQFP